MTIVALQTQTGSRTQGGPSAVDLSFSGVTGNNCVLVVKGISHHDTSTSNQTVSWKGVDLGLGDIGVVNGAGDVNTNIWVEVLGDLTGESGHVVIDKSSGSDTSLGCEATIYANVDQGSPIRDTDSYFTQSALNNAQNDLAGLTPGDLIVDAFCAEGSPGPAVPGGSQTEIVQFNPLDDGLTDAAEAGTSFIVATGPTQQVVYTTTSASGSRAYVALALAALTGVVISDAEGTRGAGKSVPPGDLNVDVDVIGADGTGTTKMYLANDVDFGTAVKTEQVISAITASTLNWDEVVLGTLDAGPLFLFVVADDGGPGEDVSAPFPILISAGQVLAAGRLIVLDGTESGLTTIVNDLEFVPRVAWIRTNGNTVRGSFNPHMVNSICHVDEQTSHGSCTAGNNSPTVTKRKQASETNTLIVQDASSSGASDQVLGTPTLTDDGIEIDFSASTQDIELLIFFFGGETMQGTSREITISDGSLGSLGHRVNFAIGHSSNQTAGAGSDTTFNRMSMGFAKSALSAEQFNIVGDADGSPRNISLEDGSFLRQIDGTGTTWTMSITSFDSEGISWSGSNGDSAFVLFLDLDDAQTYASLWAKESVGDDGISELLPDTGIDNLRFIFQVNAARTDQLLSPSRGYRWDTGAAGSIAQHTELNSWLPNTGSGTAEQRLTLGRWAENQSGPTSLSIVGEITNFARQSTVLWHTNTPNALLFGLFGWESLGDEKTIEQDAATFAGVVPSDHEVTVGEAPDLEQDVPPTFVGFVPIDSQTVPLNDQEIGPNEDQLFAGTVPIHCLRQGAAPDLEQDVPPTFAGFVPGGEIPTPGLAVIEQGLPDFAGVVPGGAMSFSLHQILQGPQGFVGFVPADGQLNQTMFQLPPDFAGFVPGGEVVSGPRTISQIPAVFAGVVSEGTLVAGTSLAIEQGLPDFAGTVPVPSVVPLLGQQDAGFVGTVPAPTIAPGASPPITPDEPVFVGVVPGGAIKMLISQPIATFVGHVPEPFAVILRDPDGRRHLSLGLGA